MGSIRDYTEYMLRQAADLAGMLDKPANVRVDAKRDFNILRRSLRKLQVASF